MKFNEFKYERPDFESFKSSISHLTKKITDAYSVEEVLDLVKEVNVFKNTLHTARSLASIRFTINTEDAFYKSENEYWDKYGPLYAELDTNFKKALLNSEFRSELEEKLGSLYFALASNAINSFAPEIIEELQEENRLSSEYNKLIASAKIKFGEITTNLAGITPYSLDNDREKRKLAQVAKYLWFQENEEKIDNIYDSLVKVRDKIAKKLGYENFIPVGYMRMNRIDYNPEMVDNFRKNVREHIVPLATTLYEEQRERLGLKELKHYDEKFEFLSGNAKPHGNPEWIVEQARVMYKEMSPETDEFFTHMVEGDLMDLVTKPGKAGGGYCTSIPNYKTPFIFSNFNGTSGDVDVLTHEAGHAFQGYNSMWIELPELVSPTLESCEIHSMSMEYFAWPWMELFFKEETDKYKYAHLGGSMKFIPYGVLVDHFQHAVYENPNMTPAERKAKYRELEKMYLPHKDYSECDFLERGGWFFQQAHIFKRPFYYIDYTLAETCAMQFWKRCEEDRDSAWADYVKLCKVGGTKSFLSLVEYANLKSPFVDGTIEEIVQTAKEYLSSIDSKAIDHN